MDKQIKLIKLSRAELGQISGGRQRVEESTASKIGKTALAVFPGTPGSIIADMIMLPWVKKPFSATRDLWEDIANMWSKL